MPIPVSDYKQGVFRKFPLPVLYKKDGEVKEETLEIKYKPFNQTWLDEWDAIFKRVRAKISQQNEQIVSSAFDAAVSLIEAHANGYTPQTTQDKAVFLSSLISLIEDKSELTDEQKDEQKKLMARQLSTVLIDVDMLDEEKKPVEPTADFLYELDFEFLLDVGAGVVKKIAQARMS